MMNKAMPWVDAHCHLWALDRGDYGWLDSNNPELTPIVRDFTPTDLHAAYPPSSIDASILVQAAPTDAETDYLLSLAADMPGAAGVVGWVDLGSAQLAARLDTLAANPLCRGIRPMLQDITATDWILQPAQHAGLAVLLAAGLRFDALITARHLPALRQVCQAFPDLPVIIDHAAKPALAAMDEAQLVPWMQGMQALGQTTMALCKLSGLLTEMHPTQTRSAQQAVAVLQPLFDQLLEWFGAERLVWGSDWPVVTLAAELPLWLEVTTTLLNPLSTGERSAILGGNAIRFYGLDRITP